MVAPAYINHAYSAAGPNPHAMALPGSLVVGNVLIAMVRYGATGLITDAFTPPAGWSVIYDDYNDPNTSGRCRMWTMSRVVDGTETSPVNVTVPNFVQTGIYSICAQFSGISFNGNLVSTEGGGFVTLDGTVDPAPVVTSGPERIGIIWDTHINDNSVPSLSFSGWVTRDQRWQFEWDNDTSFLFCTKDLTVSGTYDPESVATAGRNSVRSFALVPPPMGRNQAQVIV